MIAPSVTYPTTNTLEWYDSLAITLSGYVDVNSVIVQVNGDDAIYDPITSAWSYSVTLSGYNLYNFVIISGDSYDNFSPGTNFDLTINSPFICQTVYNELEIDLVGEVNSVTKTVEASLSGSGFTNSNITFLPHTNNFVYNNFVFNAPVADIYLRAGDDFGNYSDVTFESLEYKISPPIISSLTLPVTSINVGISGTADIATSGFIYSPTGGIFASGYSATAINWDYNFIILSNLETFSIQAVDIFGQDSEAATLEITYELPAPVFTEPTYSVSSDKIYHCSGTCNPNSMEIIYSTSSTNTAIKILSASSEFYNIDITNNELNLTINNETAFITLDTGIKTTQNIVDNINRYFTKEVAQVYSNKISLTGNRIIVNYASANSFLGFEEKSYLVAVNISCPDTVIFTGRNTLELNVDGIDYVLYFLKDTNYTSQEIIDTINAQVGYTLAFEGSLNLVASENIYIKKAFSDLGITDVVYSGVAYLDNGNWGFDFPIYSTINQIYVTALDNFYNYTANVSKQITYQLSEPFFITPGTPRSLTDNIAISGSTTDIFVTMNGDFLADGVIIGDYVLATSGANVGNLQAVSDVTDTTLVTNSFEKAWASGDTISVYSIMDRPTYLTKQVQLNCTGKADINSSSLIYSDQSSLSKIKIYSTLSEPFNIPPQSNFLNLTVGNETESIELSVGSGFTAAEITTQINDFFNEEVAFVDSTKIYIQGYYVNIASASANAELGFSVGEYKVAYEIICDDSITLDASNTTTSTTALSLFVDDNPVLLNFPYGTYAKTDIINRINNFLNKEVAFFTSTGMMILGKKDIFIVYDFLAFGFSRQVVGIINFLEGKADWNTSFTILKGNFNLTLTALDAFYVIVEGESLGIQYKLDPPVVSNSTLTVYVNTISLLGTYDTEGKAVFINGTAISGAYGGSWTHTLEYLTVGGTSVAAKVEDIFGGYSDTLDFVVDYVDPNQAYITPIEGPLTWKRLTTPNLIPEILRELINSIESLLGGIIALLKTVTHILELAKAFILGPLNFLRAVVQDIINKIMDILLDFLAGAGIYILNTLPLYRDFINNGTKSTITDFLGGGFSGFIQKVVTSFDDPGDNARPQMSSRANVAGFIFAIDSGEGVNQLIYAVSEIMRFLGGALDYGLQPPKNLKAKGENNRVVLTWESPSGFNPDYYLIRKSTVSGGLPMLAANAIDPSAPDTFALATNEFNSDPTGKIFTNYDYVGVIETSPFITSYKFVDGPNLTADETAEMGFIDKAIALGANAAYLLLTGQGVGFISKTAYSGQTLANGTQYFYIVTPFVKELILSYFDNLSKDATTWITSITNMLGLTTILSSGPIATTLPKIFTTAESLNMVLKALPGTSSEVSATPNMPTIVQINDILTDQMLTQVSLGKKAVNYQLSSGIYDKNTGLPSSNPGDIKISIDFDRVVTPILIRGAQGHFTLKDTDAPDTVITATYYGKAVENLTRAKIVSSNSGPFTFYSYDNTLVLQVGTNKNLVALTTDIPGLNLSTNQTITFTTVALTPVQNAAATAIALGLASSISTISTQATTTPTLQTMQSIAKAGKQVTPYSTGTIFTADQVASIIRSQTSGLTVYVDRLNRIVLEETLVPNIYKQSYIEVISGNNTLGFTTGQKSTAGPTSVPPDWYSLRLTDLFPYLSDVIKQIEAVLKSILGFIDSIITALSQFMDGLINKIALLTGLLNSLYMLIYKLEQLLTIKVSLYYLQIPFNTGGVTYFKNAITTAAGAPANTDYAGGVVFLVSDGGVLKALNYLFSAL